MKPRWLLAGFCAALFGCGTSVDDVCEMLAKDCGLTTSAVCENDGESVESKADTANCSDQFDAYLKCLDDQGCGWHTACAAEAKTLEACGVSLVPQ